MTPNTNTKPTTPDTIHQCELLEYFGLYLELAYPEDLEFRRWTLRGMKTARLDDALDMVYQEAVAFCPGCGLDCRQDLFWRVPGRPAQNRLLKHLRTLTERPCSADGTFGHTPEDEREPNARLIAAAPELANALEELLDEERICDASYDRARNALRMAGRLP